MNRRTDKNSQQTWLVFLENFPQEGQEKTQARDRWKFIHVVHDSVCGQTKEENMKKSDSMASIYHFNLNGNWIFCVFAFQCADLLGLFRFASIEFIEWLSIKPYLSLGFLLVLTHSFWRVKQENGVNAESLIISSKLQKLLVPGTVHFNNFKDFNFAEFSK